MDRYPVSCDWKNERTPGFFVSDRRESQVSCDEPGLPPRFDRAVCDVPVGVGAEQGDFRLCPPDEKGGDTELLAFGLDARAVLPSLRATSGSLAVPIRAISSSVHR